MVNKEHHLGATRCPNCGRYIGPVDRCPYCLQPVPRPPHIMALRYGTLALAVLLIIGFWQWAVYNPPPGVNIGDISKSMNYARITIKGMVTGVPNIYENDYGGISSLYFYLDDGTGSIKVTAYETAAKEMITRGMVPGFGDKVEIKGANVLWRGGDVKVIISTADQITIMPRTITPVNVSTIAGDTNLEKFHEGDFVRLTGTAMDDLSDMGSFYLFDLGTYNASSVVDVYISGSVVKLTGYEIKNGTLNDIITDSEVKVVGALKKYKDRWEVVVNDCMDITLIKKGGVY